jgi:hypothetical protein
MWADLSIRTNNLYDFYHDIEALKKLESDMATTLNTSEEEAGLYAGIKEAADMISDDEWNSIQEQYAEMNKYGVYGAMSELKENGANAYSITSLEEYEAYRQDLFNKARETADSEVTDSEIND